MAAYDEHQSPWSRTTGLVPASSRPRRSRALPGAAAIGHTRYSTPGSANWTAAQPVYRDAGSAGFALAHNGNLTNVAELAARAGREVTAMLSDSTWWPSCWRVEVAPARRSPAALADGPARGRGRLLAGPARARRGARGARPLRPAPAVPRPPGHRRRARGLGRRLRDPGARPRRRGLRARHRARRARHDHRRGRAPRRSCSPPADVERLCIFEFVYFARPDAYLTGRQVHSARRRMGELLAEQAPVDADLVMGVPDSGVPAAEGFAKRSRDPLRLRAGQEPLHRAHVHRARPGRARRRGAAQAQPAAREHRGPAPGRRRRLHRARHHDPRALVTMLRDAGAPRSTCASRRRPSPGPATTESTRRRATSCWRPPHTVDEMRDVHRARLARVHHAREPARRPSGLDGECCDACLTGDYPAPVPVALGSAPAGAGEPAARRARRALTYAAAGVSIEAGDAAVRRIAPAGRDASRPGWSRASGASRGSSRCARAVPRPVLVASTDGVGTKLEVARRAGPLRHDRRRPRRHAGRRPGVLGAEPLFVLDYLAVGRLDAARVEAAGRRGGRGLPPGRLRRCSAARRPSTPASWSPTSSTSRASPSAWSSATRSPRARAGARRRRAPRPGVAGAALPTATRSRAASSPRRAPSTARRGREPSTLGDELLRPSVIYARRGARDPGRPRRSGCTRRRT